MTRLLSKRARIIGSFFATLALVVGMPAVARAQTNPHPVIDSSPRKVRFQGQATIEGHLEEGAPEQKVVLQRRRSDSWTTVDRELTNSNNRVTFSLNDMRRRRELPAHLQGPIRRVRRAQR